MLLSGRRRNSKLINVSWDSDISRRSAHSIVHSQVYTEKLWSLGAEQFHRRSQSSSNWTLCHEFGTLRRSRIEIPAVYCYTDETWINHAVPETKQKNPWSPNNRHFRLQRNSEQLYALKKVMTTVFWDHNGVFLAYFLDRRATAHVELCYNTHGGLRQVICLGDSAKA
jgi:hypothetical protein